LARFFRNEIRKGTTPGNAREPGPLAKGFYLPGLKTERTGGLQGDLRNLGISEFGNRFLEPVSEGGVLRAPGTLAF